jgi:hypothetical protein
VSCVYIWLVAVWPKHLTVLVLMSIVSYVLVCLPVFSVLFMFVLFLSMSFLPCCEAMVLRLLLSIDVEMDLLYMYYCIILT